MRRFIATLERQRTETAQVVVEFDDADLPKETLPREWAGKLARARARLAQFASESKPLRVTNLQEMEDEIQSFRDTCFFCDQKFGDCDCPWPSAAMGSFKWNNIDIRSPNADETGRSFVDPVAYYGDAFTRWWKQRGARWPGRRRFKGHPEIAIPRCLLDAGFEDVSWKNDENACAHLELTDGRLLVAWVGEAEEPKRPLSPQTMERIAAGVKKYGLETDTGRVFVDAAGPKRLGPKRFALMIGPKQHIIDGDEPTQVIETDDEKEFAEAVALLAKQAAPKPELSTMTIFGKVRAAMDFAEGPHGPVGEEYDKLMKAIEVEARRRREAAAKGGPIKHSW